MISFLWLSLVVLVVFIAAFLISNFRFKGFNTITFKESMVGFLVAEVVLALAITATIWSNRTDYEILNGVVEDKYSKRVSCSHSYPCNCRTVKTGKTTSTVCDTCYSHPYDVDWVVKSNVGSLRISRVNSQGTIEPPRFTEVILGEPFAMSHSYQNYILGARDSLFGSRLTPEQSTKMPSYGDVYDYYRFNHTILYGNVNVDQKIWNNLLSNTLISLGNLKQVNIRVVFTDKTEEFVDELESHFVGGKKNDVTIVYGVTGDAINYVRAFTFARSYGNELTVVELRDSLFALGNISEPHKHIEVMTNVIQKTYKRTPMEHFEYLASASDVSASQLIYVLIFALVISVGINFMLHHDDFL